MMDAKEIIKQLDYLTDKDCVKVLEHLKKRLNVPGATVLNKSYDWWDNKEDDIYNEQ